MRSREPVREVHVSRWTAELAGTNDELPADVRLDTIERLTIVGEPWCVPILERARTEDVDEALREAADAALIVIGARATARTPHSFESTSP